MYTTCNKSRAAFDRISADLSQKVDTVTSELKNLSIISHGNIPASSSGSSTNEDVSLFALLGNSKLLPRLDPNNHQKVEHWYPGAYRKLRRKAPKTGDAEDDLNALGTDSVNPVVDSESMKKGPILSRFLEDKDGNLIPESQKKAILATAASFWQYLLDKKRVPKTFRLANIETKLKWQTLMESSFECLRYCDNHWKVDQIWINYFPSWFKTALRKIEEDKAKKAAENTVIDVDDDDDNDEEDDEEEEDNNDDGDGNEDIEEANRGRKNKRGPPDNSETSKSKRARVEPEKSTPPPPPAPTTRRARVCTLYSSTICVTNNV